MSFQAGEKIIHRKTGEIATVTHYTPSCGNVYIGDNRQEITVADWERYVEPAPSEPVPVATNGNGHSTTEVPPLHAFERERERV